MIHVDDSGYGRTMGAISGLIARAYGFAPIEDWKTMRRVLMFALAFRFGKPAIVIVGIELVPLAVYLVRLLV